MARVGFTTLAPAVLINTDPDMLFRMESDLQDKTRKAFTAAGVTQKVYGIFSVDDLEKQRETDLCAAGTIAVGVGYLGCFLDDQQRKQTNQAKGNSANALEFRFLILLAVPAGDNCEGKYDGTQLLTILRLGILGSRIDGDNVNRTWEFVQEKPEVGESSKTVLYYSQVWRVVMPANGNYL